MMQVRDKIVDCYMRGIGPIESVSNPGFIEAIGLDWVVVRDKERNEPIFVDRSIEDLEEFLKN